MHDLVVVGGGPAGLAIAYHLRDLDLDIAVLEASGDVGGRTRSVPVGGLTSNTGALFVYRGTPAETLAADFGISTVPFEPTTFGVHLGATTVVDSDNDRVFDRLPLSDLARGQLKDFVATALAEYDVFTDGGRLTDRSAELVDERVSNRLAGLEPEVVDIITRGVQCGSTASPADLSAQWALRYFASYLAHEAGNRLYPVDGMQAIPRGLAERLEAGVVRLDSTVRSVRGVSSTDSSEHYDVELADGGRLEARHVALAVPAPVALEIAPDLPGWKREALSVVKTPGSTTLCVTADVTGVEPVSDWAFLITCGRPFDGIINPTPGRPRRSPDGRLLAQFVCYGNSAGYRPDLVEGNSGRETWIEEFLAVAPQLRGRVEGAHLQTWRYCFAILSPERLGALESLQSSVGRLHFAGDHTSATAGTHGAYTEARRVADLVRADARLRATR